MAPWRVVMQRDREQFWLVAACVIAGHAFALAIGTGGWVYWGAGSGPGPKALEIAAAEPVVVMKDPEPPEPNSLGETDATGDSIATVDLPTPSVSDTPDDIVQAWTRQRPAPLPSAVVDETRPASQTPSLGPESVTPVSPLAVRSTATAKTQQVVSEPPPDVTAAELTKDQPPEPSPQLLNKTPAAADEPAQPQQVAQKPDPAQAGDSDFDPFATEEGVSFSPGGTSARRGREAKLSRPRIDLGFRAEATRIWGRGLVVRMRIETDAAGHPSRVVVLESSGSDVIDDAVRLAMYDSWFGGKMPDSFVFTVKFVDR